VPNIALNITESYSWLVRCVNLLLPLGVYTWCVSRWKKIGITTLLMIPFMVLAAFQLVLLYLYGSAIIAIDMFLNVVTTNMSEATELLANLTAAIVVVVVLYLPPLVMAILSIIRKKSLSQSFRKRLSKISYISLVISIILCFLSAFGSRISFRKEVFPVNVINNMAMAVNRHSTAENYPITSADFSYHAHRDSTDTEREIYVYVIGETSRAENWALAGYQRDTNPRLSKVRNLVFFKNAISESNTTHKSVPMLLSFACAENFDSIHYYKSIITAMKEAGFYTRFFSNQAPNHSFVDFFGSEADDVQYTDLTIKPHAGDGDLLPMVDKAIADTQHRKQFIVLHTYGSHFLYTDRYPRSYAHFSPDIITDASVKYRDVLVNSYDNSIRYTDDILSRVIAKINATGCRGALLYSSDHGEDIFDDKRERFLHASPVPSFYQLHVAMFAWLSDRMIQEYPEYLTQLTRNAAKAVSPQKSLFNTAMEIVGIKSNRIDPTKSLVSPAYKYTSPVYLTDLNEAVPLSKSGIKKIDNELFDKLINGK
jgi:glucan phosphoethanolaminetransferase (alkaline phosphatase superfamily)